MDVLIGTRLLAVVVLAVLGCLFPNLLIDAMKAGENDREKRYRVGACFGGILLLLVWILN